MKVLFLYSELAGYFISCLDNLSKRGVEIHLVHLPVNKEAPFVFFTSPAIFRYERSSYDEKQLIELTERISPDAIYCSGWIDKVYLKVCKRFRNNIPVIVGFDNKWSGTLKQKAATLFSNVLLHRYFSHCWIPGNPQLSYAHRLKFPDKNILTGFYSCNYSFFHDIYLKYKENKKRNFPHRLIFAGRYYDFKGIKDLWKAFAEIQNENPSDWELWCLGTGDIEPLLHPKIKHFGFVQPDKIEKFIAECGVFVLPSTFEPWGVALHEFASAGFPLICSDEVGAAEVFIKEGENGLIFFSGNIRGLKTALKKIMSIPDGQLFAMGEKSVELAGQITPDTWSDTLMSVINKSK